jgi:hypothetical protein
MSVAGTWKLSMKTPFGVQTPTLSIDENGGKLEGANGPADIQEVQIDGNSFSFNSKVKTPMGTFPVSFRGTVSGDEMEGTYKSMAGVTEFSGERG